MEKRLASVLLPPPANSNCKAIENDALNRAYTRGLGATFAYKGVSLLRFAAHEPFVIPVAPIMAAILSLIGRQIPWGPKVHDPWLLII
jgi:hypothetical protein